MGQPQAPRRLPRSYTPVLEPLAGKLNSALAHRAAVDARLVPNDSHVGRTAKVIAP